MASTTYVAKSNYQVQIAGIPGYLGLWTMLGDIVLPREKSVFKDGKGKTITLLGILRTENNSVSIEKPYDLRGDLPLINWHKKPSYPEDGLILTATPKDTNDKLLYDLRLTLKGVFIESLTLTGADLNQTAPEAGKITASITFGALDIGDGVR